MEKFEKQAVRQFSREHDKEGRKKTADEIRESRAPFFAEKSEKASRIQEYTEELAAHKLNLDQALSGREKLEDELSEKEKSLLSRIWNRAAIRDTKKEIGDLDSAQKEFEAQYEEKEAVLAQERELELDKSGLDKARKTLEKFYGREAEKIRVFFEKEREDGDVANVIEKEGVVFVHGTLLDMVPEANSLVRNEATWQDKIKILCALEPTVSTSAIKAGYGRRTIWAPVGALLAGGHVEYATSGDGASRAKSLTKRATSRRWTDPIGLQIEQTLEASGGQYNEFVVAKPKIAGLYAYVESEQEKKPMNVGGGLSVEYRADPKPIPYHEVEKLAAELGVPFYAIQNGKVFEAKVEIEKRVNETARKLGSQRTDDILRVRLGREVPAKELAGKEVTIPNAQKDELVEEVLVDTVFQTRHIPERGHFDDYADGQRIYREIAAGKTPYAVAVAWTAAGNLQSFEDYFDVVRASLEGIDVSSKKHKGEDFLKKYGYDKKYASHLYGFAKAAREAGDEESATRAEQLAATLWDKSAVEEVLRRRTSSKGGFKLVRSDFEVAK